MEMKVETQATSVVAPCRPLLKVCSVLFFLLCASGAFAQGSHWFFGAGAGEGIYFSDHNRQMKFMDRPAFGAGAFVGKWWSPIIGTRVGYAFQTIRGATQNGCYLTTKEGEVYDPSRWSSTWLYKQKYDIGHAYGDVLFDVTSIFCSKEDRFYSLVPYVGLGWMRTYTWANLSTPQDNEISASIGLLNTFRLGKHFDLMLDVRGAAVDDRFDGELGGRKKEGLLSAHLGLIYNFGPRGWENPCPTDMSDAERMSLNDRITDMMRENASLRESLASAPKVIEKEPVIQTVTVVEKAEIDFLILFPIGKSVLTNYGRAQLGILSELINKYPDRNYVITGYADASTGTPTLNERLSRARAESAKATLVKEFHIDANRLRTVAAGGVANQYYNDAALSRSVIIRLDK